MTFESSSVSNNVKETYGVPAGSSRFLAYVKQTINIRITDKTLDAAIEGSS